MSKVTLYLGISSPFSRFLDYVVQALKIEDNVERKYVDLHAAGGGEHKTEEMIKINPRQQLPMLQDGDLQITESRAIAIYLCEKFDADGKLYPRDMKVRAKVHEAMFFDCVELTPIIVAHFRKTFGTPLPQDMPGKIKTTFNFFELMLGGRKFVVGDSLTVADLGLLTTLSLTHVLELDLKELSAAVAEYYSDLAELIPNFKQENAETEAKLAKFIETRKAAAAAAAAADAANQ